jgi:hypothetical protein
VAIYPVLSSLNQRVSFSGGGGLADCRNQMDDIISLVRPRKYEIIYCALTRPMMVVLETNRRNQLLFKMKS